MRQKKVELDMYYVNTNSYNKLQVNISKDYTEKSGKLNFNKRPKGQHNMHRSTMCNLLMDWPGRPFLYTNRPKNTNLVKDVKILLPVKFR